MLALTACACGSHTAAQFTGMSAYFGEAARCAAPSGSGEPANRSAQIPMTKVTRPPCNSSDSPMYTHRGNCAIQVRYQCSYALPQV